MSAETKLQLLPIRWFAVKEADMQRMIDDRQRVSPQISDLMIAASAQSVHHRPGVVAEARRLAGLLDGLDQRWPTGAQVRSLLQRDPAAVEHYTLHEDGERWYLRSPALDDYERPFARNRWCLVWQAPAGMEAITADGPELLDMMRLMPLLDGSYSLDRVIAELAGNEPARRLLLALSGSGVLREGPATPLELERIPPFLFLGHSGLAVRHGEHLLVVDPVGRPDNERLSGQRPLYQLLNRASLIVISHHHWDHLDFQTLTRIRRDVPMIVPACERPSASNPPMAPYLRELGFVDVREHRPGEIVSLGGLELRLAQFRGEAFGLDSHFDAFTYHLRFGARVLYGSVDACHDEVGGMDEIIEQVASWGSPDLFLFGSSEQEHRKPYLAGGLRHFSNELQWHPELLRYHPDVDDVARWTRILRPTWLVPYAQFLFGGSVRPDLRLSSAVVRPEQLGDDVESRHRSWLSQLGRLGDRVGRPVALLSAMQGIGD
ncbi:MAG: MBL fold metallo-hydrolase [Nannocystaceae bacterium]